MRRSEPGILPRCPCWLLLAEPNPRSRGLSKCAKDAGHYQPPPYGTGRTPWRSRRGPPPATGALSVMRFVRNQGRRGKSTPIAAAAAGPSGRPVRSGKESSACERPAGLARARSLGRGLIPPGLVRRRNAPRLGDEPGVPDRCHCAVLGCDLRCSGRGTWRPRHGGGRA
jgi:hypothetical protein